MRIHENKALVFRTRNPDKYSIIPRSAVVDEVQPGLYEVITYWGLHEARVLRNLGVKNVPSPILRDYRWPGRYTPFKHQKETSSFLTMHRRAFVFNDPGTGKSLSALWAADFLMTVGEVHRVLILCPLSIMHSVWMQDISNSIIHRSAVVAYHSSADRRKEAVRNGYEIVISNYDGLQIINNEIKNSGDFDLIIVDEATAVKTSTTNRWKTLAKLITPKTHLWMLTGTPAAQSPEDAYGLAKLVNPAGVPAYFSGWKDKVMRKVTTFRWVPKEDAYDQVYAALQPAIRFTKKECLDLPPVLVETREVEMTAQQRKYYNLIKTQLLFQTAGEVVSAVNAAAVVNKLLQISAGAAYTDARETIEFDCSPRLALLDEILEETDRKVLVFANYRHSIETIVNHLGHDRCAAITGDVSVAARTELFKRFQESVGATYAMRSSADQVAPGLKKPLRVLVIQPQAAAHGVTLTAADTVVFWGPVMSVEAYIQCIARTDRVGQTSESVRVIHIQGSETERRMFKKLAGRVADNRLLLDIYEEELQSKK